MLSKLNTRKACAWYDTVYHNVEQTLFCEWRKLRNLKLGLNKCMEESRLKLGFLLRPGKQEGSAWGSIELQRPFNMYSDFFCQNIW